MTFAYNPGGGTREIRVLDTAFREMAKLESPPSGTLELDVARKRVLLAHTETVGATQQSGILSVYDYSLNPGASKRFHLAVPIPDSVAPGRAGQTFLPSIGQA